MASEAKFQGLKQLHDKLHSKKGLTNVVTVNRNCSSKNSKFIQGDLQVDGEEHPAQSVEGTTELADGALEERDSTALSMRDSLINVVKDLYKENNVKLTEHKIFVGNISYKLTTSQLKTFFLSFGRVLHAQIVKDRVKKWSKGYGFITFSKDSEIQKVLQASEDELILDGRTLRIDRAEKKRRGRPIRENNEETDPKTSIEDFVKKYEASEELKCNQTEECEETFPVEGGTDCSNDGIRMDDYIVDISSLNDDTLLYIFSLLTIKERVIIERVCHRWLHLSRQTWLSLTHLDFKGVFRSFRGTGGLTDGILLSLFRRGCQNLISLDVSHSSRFLTDYSLYLIGQNCLELQELNLSGANVTMKSLKDLSSKCIKLKKIELQRCYEVGEKALWWLFKQCEELEYIDVGGNIRITGQCFFMLTDKCTTVILDECIKLTDSGIELLIKRCRNLETLNISNCLYLTDRGISELFTRCMNLKKLSFCKSPKDVSSQSLLALRHLNMLEELQLASQSAVNDDVLFVIGSNCSQLRILNLEACHNVTDRGIQCLTSCSQLHKLVISYIDKVADFAVELLAHNGVLRELHARSCLNITDKAIEQLALHCPNLHALDLSGSERIRNKSLDLLEEHLGDNEAISLALGVMVIKTNYDYKTKKRTLHQLNHIYGTGITNERVLLTRQCYPTWDITIQNLSDHRLRTDFDPYMDMGRILPEYDDEDEEEEFDLPAQEYDAEYYLTADDPSMWEYEEQWMS